MKKFACLMIMLAIAAPTMASVDVNAVQVGSTTDVDINYTNSEGQPVRAFSLRITVDSGTITAVDAGDPCVVDYYVYPSTIVIDGNDVTSYGTPVAPNTTPGADGTGLDTNTVVLEMGSLHDPCDALHPNPPGNSGKLCTITVSGDCNVALAVEQTFRGGIVMEDANAPGSVNLTGCSVVTQCFPTTPAYALQNADFQAYVANGWDADCWCAPPEGTGYQCDGDAAGDTEGGLKYRVYLNDINLVVANWQKRMKTPALGGANPCADVAHDAEAGLKYRVYLNDINLIVTMWQKRDTALPGDCPRPDGM